MPIANGRLAFSIAAKPNSNSKYGQGKASNIEDYLDSIKTNKILESFQELEFNKEKKKINLFKDFSSTSSKNS